MKRCDWCRKAKKTKRSKTMDGIRLLCADCRVENDSKDMVYNNF